MLDEARSRRARVPPLWDGHAAERIVDAIEGYFVDERVEQRRRLGGDHPPVVGPQPLRRDGRRDVTGGEPGKRTLDRFGVVEPGGEPVRAEPPQQRLGRTAVRRREHRTSEREVLVRPWPPQPWRLPRRAPA